MIGFYGFLIGVLAVGVTTAKEWPSYIKACKRDQSTIDNCLKMATAAIQPHMAKGIKELNIPPFEPLIIPMVKIEQGSGSISIKATLSKLKVFGLSNYVFKEFKGTFKDQGVKLSGALDLPSVKLEGDYIIDGKILLLPITGNGEFNANITNCFATFANNAITMKKKGHTEYLQTKDSSLNLQVGDASFHFENLFDGDPLLSKTTNDFLNQNVKEILNELKPAIEAVVSMLFEDIINKLFSSTPYDKLFPK